MEAVHLTMDSAQLASIIDLPISLRDCKVDVIVLPSQAVPNVAKPEDEEPKVESIMGILKQYANPSLVEQEEGAWERAAVEKYLEKMNDDHT